MDYFWTDKVWVQQREENCLFCQKAYRQIYYPQLCPNPRMFHVPLDLDGQVLVLIA